MEHVSFSALVVISLPFIIIFFIGLYGMFQKAEIEGWKGLIPFYNVWILVTKIIGRPWYWFVLLFVPIINVLIAISIAVEMSRVYGHFGFGHMVMSVILTPFYAVYLGFSKKVAFIGPEEAAHHRKTFKKSATREWIDAIAFAVVAATIIRWFFIEAYTIPTSSMEKSLLVGDFLFVSKINYGPRIPMTPLSFPFAHNTMPLIGGDSYLEWIKIPYLRLPGFEKIENGDVVVFNYPKEKGRPVDKKENYIKRCVGISGDSLKVVNAQLYVNNKLVPDAKRAQYRYYVKTNGVMLRREDLRKLHITEAYLQSNNGEYVVMMTDKAAAGLKQLPYVTKEERVIQPPNNFDLNIYPYYKPLAWNVDNFGPIYIPKRGDKIKLNKKNYYIYETPIRRYEKNPTLKWQNGQAYIKGKPVDEYQFKYSYFFMMGDNRHNSSDSRMWGFVPENHIVGKALFLWFSWDKDGEFLNKVRWNRIFNTIH